jgi:hypothetical protein
VVLFTDRVRHVVKQQKKMIFFLLVLCTVVAGQTCSCPSGSCLSTSVRYCFDTTITVPAFVAASAVEVRIRAQSTDGSVFDLRVLSSNSYTCDGSYSNQYREFSATGVACVDTGKRIINTRTFTVVFDNENSFYNAPINYLVEWTPIAPTTVAPASTSALAASTTTAAVATSTSALASSPTTVATTTVMNTTAGTGSTAAGPASTSAVAPASSSLGLTTTAAEVASTAAGGPASTSALASSSSAIPAPFTATFIYICACGPNSCQGSCRYYYLNKCQPFYSLCTGDFGGFAMITNINGSYTGMFYGDSDCSGTLRNSFSAACDTCNTALSVMPKCTGTPTTPTTPAPTTPAMTEQTLVCDGEITTCNECIAKSELGFACDWCSTSGSCHGEGDLFTTCSGTWKETCSASTPRPPSALYDCLVCDGTCASGCNDGRLFGQPLLCSRGDLIVEGGKCRSSEDPSGCCVPSTRPPSTPAPTKRTDVQSCKLNGSCDADNLCEALSAHLSCIVSSADLCGQYNQAFLSVVSQCPEAKTRCSCTTVDDPCRKSFVQCDKIQETCGACRSCECNDRCCKEKCRDQQANFACTQTNGLMSSTCSCTGVATVVSSTPALTISSFVILASCLAAYVA